MDSLTKNKKTNPEIENILNGSIDLDASVEAVSELTNGSFNAVYKIALSNGKRYVIKIAPSASVPVLRNEKNIMKAEVEALRLITEHTSVPVPKVFHYSQDFSCCNSAFTIMQWMSGEEYQYASNSYSDETKTRVLTELGEMTCAFHQIHGATFGSLGGAGTQYATWSEAFLKLYQNILEDGVDADVSLPVSYDSLFKLAERIQPFLNDVKTPCLIHGDLWLGNVLVHNGRISALLDFERSLWGDPLMEYPFGLLRNNAEFLSGYKHNSLETSDYSMKIRRTLYNLYHYLIVQIEKPYRGFKQGGSNYFVNQKIIAEVHVMEELLLK